MSKRHAREPEEGTGLDLFRALSPGRGVHADEPLDAPERPRRAVWPLVFAGVVLALLTLAWVLSWGPDDGATPAGAVLEPPAEVTVTATARVTVKARAVVRVTRTVTAPATPAPAVTVTRVRTVARAPLPRATVWVTVRVTPPPIKVTILPTLGGDRDQIPGDVPGR